MPDTETEKFVQSVNYLMYKHSLSKKEFADRANLNYSQLSKYLTGVSTPSAKVLSRIHDAFPDFNYFGDPGNDIAGDPNTPYITPSPNTKGHKVPFYDIDVSAGSIAFFSDNLEEPDYYINMPDFSDCDFIVPVYGYSMKPIINNGDKIACKEIQERSFFNYGEVYLVVTDEQRMVKRLRKAKEEGYITLSSHNEDYDDIEIPVNKILKLFIVKGIIKRNLL